MPAIDRLDALKSGDKISFKFSQYTPSLSRAGKGRREIFDNTKHFCWKDVHQNSEVLIFAKEYDSETLGAKIFPRSWFNPKVEELIVIEPEYELGKKPLYGLLYNPQDYEYNILLRAIHSKAPSQQEILNFRRTELYFNFFMGN